MQQKVVLTPPLPSTSSSMNPNPGGGSEGGGGEPPTSSRTSPPPVLTFGQGSMFSLGGNQVMLNSSPNSSPQVVTPGGPTNNGQHIHHQQVVQHIQSQQQLHPEQLNSNAYVLPDQLIDENDTFTCGKCSASFSRLQTFVAHKKSCQQPKTHVHPSSPHNHPHHSIISSVGSPLHHLSSSGSPARPQPQANSLLVQSTTGKNSSQSHERHLMRSRVGAGSDSAVGGGALDHGDSSSSGHAPQQPLSAGSPLAGHRGGDALLQAHHHHPQQTHHHHHHQQTLPSSLDRQLSSASSPSIHDERIDSREDSGALQEPDCIGDLLSSLTPSLDATMISQMMMMGHCELPSGPCDEDFEEQLQSLITATVGGSSSGGGNGGNPPSSDHHLQSSLTVDTESHHHHHPSSNQNQQHHLHHHQSLGYHDVPPNVELFGGSGGLHHHHHHHSHRSSMGHQLAHQHAFLSPIGSPSPSMSGFPSSNSSSSLIHAGLSANSSDPLMPLVASPRISTSSSSSTGALLLNSPGDGSNLGSGCSGGLLTSDVLVDGNSLSADNSSSHSVSGSPSRFLGSLLPPISSLSSPSSDQQQHLPQHRPSSLPSIVEHHPSSSAQPSPASAASPTSGGADGAQATLSPSPSLTVIHHRPKGRWKGQGQANPSGKARSNSPSPVGGGTSQTPSSLPPMSSLLVKAIVSPKKVPLLKDVEKVKPAVEAAASSPAASNSEGSSFKSVSKEQSYLVLKVSAPSGGEAGSDKKQPSVSSLTASQSSLLDPKFSGGSSSPGQPPAIHICKYCHRKFVKHSDKLQHLACHSGERPYQCLHCGKSFQQKCNLRKHIQTHRLVREELETVYRQSLQAMPHTVLADVKKVDGSSSNALSTLRKEEQPQSPSLLTSTCSGSSPSKTSAAFSNNSSSSSNIGKSIIAHKSSSKQNQSTSASSQAKMVTNGSGSSSLQAKDEHQESMIMMTSGPKSECDILEEIVELEAEVAAAAIVASGSSPLGDGSSAASTSARSSSAFHNLQSTLMAIEQQQTTASQTETTAHESKVTIEPCDQLMSSSEPLSSDLCDVHNVSQMMEMDFLQSLDASSTPCDFPSGAGGSEAGDHRLLVDIKSEDPASSSMMASQTIKSEQSAKEASKALKRSNSLTVGLGGGLLLGTSRSPSTPPTCSSAPSSKLEAQLAVANEALLQQHEAELHLQPRSPSGSPRSPANDYQCPITPCPFYSEVEGELLKHFRSTHIKCPKVQVYDETVGANKLVYRCLRKSCRCLLPTVETFYEHLMAHKRSDVDLADQELAKFLRRAEAEEEEKKQQMKEQLLRQQQSVKLGVGSLEASGIPEAETEVTVASSATLVSEASVSVSASSSSVSSQQATGGGEGVARPPKVLYKDKKYRCKRCNQRFEVASDLEEHVQTDSHHYPCAVCQEAFASDSHMKRHLSISHGATFKCAYCEKAFKTATYLKVHSVIHSGLKPFVCVVCAAAFNRRDKLKRHELVHNPVKEFKCPVQHCSREFSRPDKLKAHLVTHSGVRPYHCAHCSRSFTRPAHLKKHNKSHAADGGGSGSGDGGEKSAPTAAGSDSSSSATNAGSGLMSNSTLDHQQDSSSSMVTTFYHANSHNNHHHFHHRHHSLSVLENEGKENEKEVKEHQQQLIYQQHQLLLLQQQEQLQLQIQLQQQQQQLQQEEFKQEMSPEKEVVVQPKEMRQPRKQLLQKRKDPEDGGEEGGSKVVKGRGELMEKKKKRKKKVEEEVIVKIEIGEECEVFNFIEDADEDQLQGQLKEEFVDEGETSSCSPKKIVTKSVPDTSSPNIQTTVDNQQVSNTYGVSAHEETAVIAKSDTPISIINTTTPSSQQSPFTSEGPPLTSNVSGSLFTVLQENSSSLSPEDDFKLTLEGDDPLLSGELSSSSGVPNLLTAAPSPSPQRPLQLNLPFNLLNANSNIYLVYNCPRCTTVFFTEEAALLHQTNCVGVTSKGDMNSNSTSSTVTSSLASTSFSQALEGPSVIKPSLMLVDPSILGQHAVGGGDGGDNGGINGSGL